MIERDQYWLDKGRHDSRVVEFVGMGLSAAPLPWITIGFCEA